MCECFHRKASLSFLRQIHPSKIQLIKLDEIFKTVTFPHYRCFVLQICRRLWFDALITIFLAKIGELNSNTCGSKGTVATPDSCEAKKHDRRSLHRCTITFHFTPQ